MRELVRVGIGQQKMGDPEFFSNFRVNFLRVCKNAGTSWGTPSPVYTDLSIQHRHHVHDKDARVVVVAWVFLVVASVNVAKCPSKAESAIPRDGF